MQEIDLKSELEAMRNRLENESKEDAIMRLNRKIVANSFYPVYVPNVFYWPIENTEEITQTGRKIMKDLINKTKLL